MRELACNLSCEEFQRKLPDIICSCERIADHPHLHNCELCRALLAALDVIAQAARELYPIEDHPATLWANIESTIVKEEALQ
jgi:hypothetical protein